MSWQDKLNQSNAAFLAKVWPIIAHKCGGGNIRPVEVMTDTISRDLDMLCGIDIWQTIDGEGCRGIASRVQFGGRNWRTFTIRKETRAGGRTEFDKRREAIESGGRFVYPYLTCHAYMTSKLELLGCGLALTRAIFDAVCADTPVQQTTDATFFAVPFDAVAGIWEYAP